MENKLLLVSLGDGVCTSCSSSLSRQERWLPVGVMLVMSRQKRKSGLMTVTWEYNGVNTGLKELDLGI